MKELLILDIQQPDDEGYIQKPTKDVPTGRADVVLDDSSIKSSNSPDDIQRALDKLDQPQHTEE